MKKIIWIDVGTHFGQEYSSIFGSNFSFYYLLLKRFIGGKILNRGRFVSFDDLKHIFLSRRELRKLSNNFYTIFVEANSKILSKKNIYLKADEVFNIALFNDSKSPLSVTKLYLGNGDELSQGSSVFLEKDNVNENSYVTTIGVSTHVFFHQLKLHIDEMYGDYEILLRLNCEGSEDDVIYSLYEIFGNKVKMVSGSLKDVKGVKGVDAYQKLEKFMDENKLPFVFFSSAIDSWAKAHAAINNLTDKKC